MNKKVLILVLLILFLFTKLTLADNIIYSLNFIQLDSSIASKFEASITTGEGQDTTNSQVNIDDELLEIAKKQLNSLSFEMNIRSGNQQLSYVTNYLVTSGTNNSQFLLSEGNINTTKGDSIDSNLEINIKPQQIDIAKARVLTEIKLDYKKDNNIVNLVNKAWLDSTNIKPIAVIKQQKLKDGLVEDKYFALALNVELMDKEDLVSNKPFIMVGNVGGIKDIFNSDNQIDLNKNKLSFYYKKNNSGYNYLLQLQSYLYNSKQLMISANLKGTNNKDITYNNIYKPQFELGITDKVVLNRFNFDLSYYFTGYDFKAKKAYQPQRIEAKLGYNYKRSEISYKLSKQKKDLTEEMALSYRLFSKSGLELIWKGKEKNNLFLGIFHCW